MAKGTLGQVIQRAISDAAFRNRLRTDPGGALSGFDLTPAERSALQSGDATKLASFGVDQRMSKAFAMGEAAAGVTKLVGTDLSVGAAIIDGGSPLGTNAILEDTSGDARSALDDSSGAVRSALDGDPASTSAASTTVGWSNDLTALEDQGSNATSAASTNVGWSNDLTALEDQGSNATSAFMTPDEMGSTAIAPDPDTAIAQREALDGTDAAIANPEGYERSDGHTEV